MNQTKIVVTGMGAVTPVGIGVETFWNSLLTGVSGVAPITRFDTASLPVHMAGMVRDFDAKALIPKEYLKNLAQFGQYAYVAADEAARMSGIDSCDPFRTGIVMGIAMGGVTEIAEVQSGYDTSARKKVSPRFVPRMLSNMGPCQVAIAHNYRGPSMTVSTACSSGIDAVNLACMMIQAGRADAVMTLGGESGICPTTISSLSTCRALSHNNENPAGASRPFDLHRDGFVMGEGGGALVLEREEHALKRGAVIYGEIVSCANNNDAFHITSPRPGGEGGALCMQEALDIAGLSGDAIGYVNAHGTATVKGDAYECAAIRTVFGAHADSLPVSSTKGATGHMMGAGGILETIACLLALRDDQLPPTLNYATPDPECSLDIVAQSPRHAHIDYAMNNALGFGGQNASMVVGRYR